MPSVTRAPALLVGHAAELELLRILPAHADTEDEPPRPRARRASAAIFAATRGRAERQQVDGDAEL